jgi:hypothetical protein
MYFLVTISPVLIGAISVTIAIVGLLVGWALAAIRTYGSTLVKLKELELRILSVEKGQAITAVDHKDILNKIEKIWQWILHTTEKNADKE